MAGINHDVINIRIKNQECRQALSCVSDPLHDILKKKEKKTHEHFLSGLEKRSSTDYFSPDKTSTAESAAVATKSYGYTEEFDDYTSASSKDSFILSLSKSEKKKKDKKKSKKRKKQGKKLLGFLDDNLLEKNPRNANLLADVYKSSQDIVAKDGFMYVYSDDVDLSMLHRQEYAASLSNALLNVAPDLKNTELKDVGFFKSLVSHDDTIMARSLYSNPTKIRCETKMLFSSNHLISFSPDVGIYDIEAVFNRLLYFPFQNAPIKDEENNKHLSDELYEKERDAIFTWAMGGLRYYVEHNETFPECGLSAEIKARNVAQYCPEKIFFSEAIKKADGKFESSLAIKEAFDEFCIEIGAKTKGDIHSYLAEHEGIVKLNTKKRIDSDGNPVSEGNPIYVYEGIRLRKKYKSNK